LHGLAAPNVGPDLARDSASLFAVWRSQADLIRSVGSVLSGAL